TRGSVLPIFHPNDFQKVFAEEFSNRATTLNDRYNEMVSGLVPARIPTSFELEEAFERPASAIWRGTFGVVDIFTGFGLVDFFSKQALFKLTTNPDRESIITALLTLGRSARLKALYIARGLHEAWSVIQKLKQLARRTDIDKTDRPASWSLRE